MPKDSDKGNFEKEFAAAMARLVDIVTARTGWSLRDWAAEAGVSMGTISHYTTGRVRESPRADVLHKVFYASGLARATLNDLFSKCLDFNISIAIAFCHTSNPDFGQLIQLVEKCHCDKSLEANGVEKHD